MTPDDERALASFLARPGWPVIRLLLAELLKADMNPLDQLIARVRREIWRDFSEPT